MGYLDLEIDQLCINLEGTKAAHCDSKSIRNDKQNKFATRVEEDQRPKRKIAFLVRKHHFQFELFTLSKSSQTKKKTC